ncbi:MAG: ORF6N domain-containing protein, partial [Elusimicrobia bacterium]|nr:ORF6N domain-containing protein [Elusimicrobiota bacterium]
PTRRLNEQVRRNRKRFPTDFMFQLTAEEWENLRLQIGISSLRSQIATSRRGGRRYRPFAFTEQGVAMLSSVLNSERAIEVNIMIMRAFVRIRQMVSLNRALAKRLAAIERHLTGHDADILKIYELLQNWPAPLEETRLKDRLGF